MDNASCQTLRPICTRQRKTAAVRARDTAPMNRPILAMLELFLKVLRERNSVMTLQWPRGSRDISILHPLAMLALIGSSPERATGGFKWCPAVADSLARERPATTQRCILVDRNEMIKRNGLQLTRGQVGEAELSPELGKLTLCSATFITSSCEMRKNRIWRIPRLASSTTFGALGGDNTASCCGQIRGGERRSHFLAQRETAGFD